jgi:rhodanese-related sulfurtransferase
MNSQNLPDDSSNAGLNLVAHTSGCSLDRELEQNPVVIRGALHMGLHEIPSRRKEIPYDQDIILYCTCPNKVTSARVALQLRRHGIARVRPLLGGIDAWRARDFPTQLHALTPMSV